MSKILIGTDGKHNTALDLDVLLRTRLLIQANSGGGKSWLLRRIAEQAFGKVQIIIIDPEGEFATLREKFDFVLVGKGGETPADIRSAGLVATKLLELHASAVCDLYEMRVRDRHQWVKIFLETMINAPKTLWHPLLVILDEAHQFCPEKGAGESEAADAVIDLATKGRKRGFCAILATQRLGKLRKDAAAEMLNVLIGQTFIDIDRKRAAEALGIPHSDWNKFSDEIKVTDPGRFWALGRAISKERILIEVGSIETTHPEPGSSKHSAEPPPAPAKIKSLLPSLADLPKEAERKIKTEAELRAEINELKRQLAIKPPAPAPEIRTVEVPVMDKALLNALKEIVVVAEKKYSAGITRAAGRVDPFTPTPRPYLRPAELPRIQSIPRVDPLSEAGKLQKAERSILTVLAQYADSGRTKTQLAILAGYAVNGGGFNNAIGALRSRGLVNGSRDSLIITPEGTAAIGSNYEPLPTGRALQDYWLHYLQKAERMILQTLIDSYPVPLAKTQVAEATGYQESGGGFNNALGKLRTLELITGSINNLKASANLFEE